MVVLRGLVGSTTEGRNSSRPSLMARARLFYSARPTKTAMLRRLVRLGKILLVNWLIPMPAVLVKIAYSAQNSARYPKKFLAPRAVFIFANIVRNLPCEDMACGHRFSNVDHRLQ